MADEPQSGTTTGTLMVVSGFTNLAWSGGLALVCLPCIGPAASIPAVIGITEIIVGATILGREPSSRVQIISILGLLSGVVMANPFSIGLEIAALVMQSNKPKQIEGD